MLPKSSERVNPAFFCLISTGYAAVLNRPRPGNIFQKEG
jgi:hypothetical protein